ncbi:MAG: hypothetical protein JXB15_01590 [Anaerolineales bacterium]|nr:hypothetical protein [Anaerolineales bacterium]
MKRFHRQGYDWRISTHQKIIYPMLLITSLALAVISGSCSSLITTRDPALRETELELNVQQTLQSQQEVDVDLENTRQAQQSTLEAIDQETRIAQQASPTIDAAQAAQMTVQSLQVTQPATPLDATEASTPIPPTAVSDLDSMMKSANILLYEDMVGKLDTNRYVKDTLDGMGLPYKDDGSAKGWLKSDVTSGAPGGKPWDLIIIAAEIKGGWQGEFFDYVEDAISKGTSVIFEVWYINEMAGGAAHSLLSKCGVDLDRNWINVPPAALAMFPLVSDDPILNTPNTLSFTATTSYWYVAKSKTDIDEGDWLKITGGGDAQLLVGTTAGNTTSHGTVTVCMERKLILQTFSSHSLTFNTMKLVWENYIYNALKVRFLGP